MRESGGIRLAMMPRYTAELNKRWGRKVSQLPLESGRNLHLSSGGWEVVLSCSRAKDSGLCRRLLSASGLPGAAHDPKGPSAVATERGFNWASPVRKRNLRVEGLCNPQE